MEKFVKKFLNDKTQENCFWPATRLKLVKKGLFRDQSASGLKKIQEKRDVSCKTPEVPRSGIWKSFGKDKKVEISQECKRFVGKTFEESQGGKKFTLEISNLYEKVKKELLGKEFFQMNAVLKSMKVGRGFPMHFSKIMADVAGIFEIGKEKNFGDFEKLEAVIKGITIGKLKKVQVLKEDSELFEAIFEVLDAGWKGNENKLTACEIMKQLLKNPGLLIKAIKEIPKNIKNHKLNKGTFYIENISKSYLAFVQSKKIAESSGNSDLKCLLLETYKIFGFSDMDSVSFSNPLQNSGKKILKTPENPEKFKKIPTVYPQQHSKNNPSLNTKFKFLLELNKALDAQDNSLVLPSSETTRESKEALLERFYSKTTRNSILKEQNSGTDLSDLTDFSENDEKHQKNSKSPRFQQQKVLKMLNGSRFCKKVNEVIEGFFKEKVEKEPIELKKLRDHVDYNWKKLDFIKENLGKWTEQCLTHLETTGIAYGTSLESRKTKHNIIVNTLAKENYVDCIVFKYQADLEKKNMGKPTEI